jgi:hypothetical protein
VHLLPPPPSTVATEGRYRQLYLDPLVDIFLDEEQQDNSMKLFGLSNEDLVPCFDTVPPPAAATPTPLATGLLR